MSKTMTTNDFLDAIKAVKNIQSDYALSHLLDVTRSCISRYRNEKSVLDDDEALKVADILGLDPLFVIACVNTERAKRNHSKEEIKNRWESIAKKLGGVAASLLMGCSLLWAPPEPVHAAPYDAISAPTLHIMLNRLKQRFRRFWQAVAPFPMVAV